MGKNNIESRIMKYPADTVIIREGELNKTLYKIVAGHAEVYVGYGTAQETLIGIIREKACFGEWGILLNEPSVYTIVAYSELFVMRITEDELGSFVQDNYTNIIDIMRNMAKTMLVMRCQIDLLLKEIEAGKKPETSVIIDARKAMFGYSMYRSIQEAVDYIGKEKQ
ncbi:MAG: cyclic nucleotide-binding domain-containing protein [Eubacterium sp.]|nr:cyclic nucleotide-binding domain-containing protein [Eubacterium sp.]